MNVSKVSKKVLLEWYTTLDANQLRKGWRFLMKSQNNSRNQRLRSIENAVIKFRLANPEPSMDDWKNFVVYLKKVGLYSKSTVFCDIFWKLLRISRDHCLS
jgi:hypothetical protein